MLHKLIASEFITTACIDFFIVAITPITMTLVVIATIYFVVLSLFSCSGTLLRKRATTRTHFFFFDGTTRTHLISLESIDTNYTSKFSRRSPPFKSINQSQKQTNEIIVKRYMQLENIYIY